LNLKRNFPCRAEGCTTKRHWPRCRINPNDAAARAALGESLYDSGEYSQAAQQFEHAVRLQPENAAWHLRLARARHGQGNLPAARQAYERARELAPEDAAPRIGLALASLAADDEAAASAVLDGVDSPTAKAVRGLIALRQGARVRQQSSCKVPCKANRNCIKRMRCWH
jgi:Flp pilus assembly protein TadD